MIKKMHKTLKYSIIAISVLIGILVIISGWFLYKMKSETDKLHPLYTGEVVKNVFAVKNDIVNLYLIKSGDKYIAIDAANDAEEIKIELNKLNIQPENVCAVLLTHTDKDHVGGLDLFKNAQIYISKDEEQMINGTTKRAFIMSNSLNGRNYKTINDNEIFNIDSVKIQGILVSGHTPGAMCYIINDKYLFTGDALGIENGKIEKFSDFFNMNSEKAWASLKKLTNLQNIEYIFTAHNGSCNDFKSAFSDYK